MEINKIVSRSLFDDRDYLVGYADLRNLLSWKYGSYGYGIVLGRRLDDAVIDSIEGGPNEDYYTLYQAVNTELAEIAKRIKTELCSSGIKCVDVAPSLTEKDRNEHFNRTLNLDFSHKMVATRAGLGWIGKSGLLVTRKYGPRVRLVSVLLDHAVDYCREPVLKGECQGCDLCVQNCPAKALSGKEWNITTRREEFFDAFACRQKCRELGGLIGEGIRLCGICISVCPVGKH